MSDLTGADGSAVSITVVDQQVDNALTVPIAAVKQNGSGPTWCGSSTCPGRQGHRGAGHDRPDRGLLHPGQERACSSDEMVIVRSRPAPVTAAGPRRPVRDAAARGGARRPPARRGRGRRGAPARAGARLACLRRGGRGLRPARGLAADHARRVHVDRGAVGLGEVDHAGSARRPRPADGGDHPDRRAGRQRARRPDRAPGCGATPSASSSSSSTSSRT